MTENKTFNKVATYIGVVFEDGYDHHLYNVSSEEYEVQLDRLIFEHGNIKHMYVCTTPMLEV